MQQTKAGQAQLMLMMSHTCREGDRPRTTKRPSSVQTLKGSNKQHMRAMMGALMEGAERRSPVSIKAK